MPYYRMPDDLVAKSWGGKGLGGERSVANHDEDSITMAVEAARDCIADFDRSLIGGLFFASTTSPYAEKMAAALVARVLDLSEDVITADFANSLRSGTAALRAAIDAVNAGSAENILVVASDIRIGRPKTRQEREFGDAAAAFIIGRENVVAEAREVFTISTEIVDVWRKSDDPFVRTWEDRWVKEHGYSRSVARAINGLLNKAELSPRDIDRAVVYAPDARSHRQLMKKLGFTEEGQVEDPLLDRVGNSGSAHSLVMLAHCLEEIRPGQRILLASYGDGADSILFDVKDSIMDYKIARGVGGYLEIKAPLERYEEYLLYRNLVDADRGHPLLVGSSATVMWRDGPSVLSLHGSRCLKCGKIQYPVQRVCLYCGEEDLYEHVRLSEEPASLFSFSLDNLAARTDKPLIQCVVDWEKGGRIYTFMTDADPSEVRIGMPVEMTFRRMREAAGFYNYFWKCRPLRR